MTLDTGLFYALNSLVGQSRLLDGLIVFCAEYLAYLVIVALVALVFFSIYSWREIVVAGAAGLIARFGVTELIRSFYHHPRPFVVLPNVHQLFAESSWSFPSGHATFFFALATVLYCYNKRWGSGFFIAAMLIALARVVAGVHYPADIVGGAFIGTIVGYGTVWVARKVAKSQYQTS